MNTDTHPHSSMTLVAFPAVVVMQNYAGDKIKSLNTGLTDFIRSLESENRLRANRTATQGGFHTQDEFVNCGNPFVIQLKNEVLIPGIQHYMSVYYRFMFTGDKAIKPEQLSFKGWANIMRKGGWNAPHEHITRHNRVSMVYYIRLPDCTAPEGALQFENPDPISAQHGAHGNIKFQPKEGDLIMFPSYQKHFSHPFNTDDERILVACDVRVNDIFDENRPNNINSLNAHTSQGGR